METIRGKMSLELTASELEQKLTGYQKILLDLGTGDGCFVHWMSERYQDHFFIGIDACRENLHLNSRRKLPNALFVIASAQALPGELNALISHVNINFPWGSLLESLLNDDTALITRLLSVTRRCAGLDIFLNAEALVTAGYTIESGADQILGALNAAGWMLKSRSALDTNSLRSFPTTWAKRLAFGRDPRALHLSLQRE